MGADIKLVLALVGGLVGLALGAAAGFGVALAIAKPRYDGSFAMREMLVCVPAGAIVGVALGVFLAVRFAR